MNCAGCNKKVTKETSVTYTDGIGTTVYICRAAFVPKRGQVISPNLVCYDTFARHVKKGKA